MKNRVLIPILKCPCCEKASLYFIEGEEEYEEKNNTRVYFKRTYIKCIHCTNVIELGKVQTKVIGML